MEHGKNRKRKLQTPVDGNSDYENDESDSEDVVLKIENFGLDEDEEEDANFLNDVKDKIKTNLESQRMLLFSIIQSVDFFTKKHRNLGKRNHFYCQHICQLICALRPYYRTFVFLKF